MAALLNGLFANLKHIYFANFEQVTIDSYYSNFEQGDIASL